MAAVDQIWSEAVRTLERDQPFALATVINVRGSTPREVGAKMIVRDDGQFGTIGGGCGEAEVFRKARLLLAEGAGAGLAEIDLTGDFDQQEIGTCGGIMDVFIDLWAPTDLAIARQLADSALHNRPAALLTVIDPGNRSEAPAGAKTVVEPAGVGDDAGASSSVELNGFESVALDQLASRAADATAGLLEVGDAGELKPVTRLESNGSPRLFLDPITGAQRLIIVGAGHIAQPLCELGTMLGFHTTVIDDRASFANRERFPRADVIIAKPFTAAIDALRLDHHCYLISVTRGHAFDEEVVRAAIKQPGCFIGMIGSKRRSRAMLARLAEDGIDPALLDEIHAPLGLDLGAETPEEIAIAIIAEIIRERRTGTRDEFTLGVKSGRLRRKR
ncbi:MAG TPA: XdhC family protein [Candidatus Binataceae bacterium]|jgi:xanthine dehydrogenase accessory factor|nr:XdhC family protein [Candidatus Binataceae bacterium]